MSSGGRSERAGLNFSVGLVSKRLKNRRHERTRVGEGASVYVAAVLEYLTTEVLDLAGHAADMEYRASGGESSDAPDQPSSRRPIKTITPAHIEQAIRNDAELKRVLQECAENEPDVEREMAALEAAAECREGGEEEEEETEDDDDDDEDGSQDNDSPGNDSQDNDSQDGESQDGESQGEEARSQGDTVMVDEENDTASMAPSSSSGASLLSSSAADSTNPSSIPASSPVAGKRKSDGDAIGSPPKKKQAVARPKPAVPLFDGSVAPSTSPVAAAAASSSLPPLPRPAAATTPTVSNEPAFIAAIPTASSAVALSAAPASPLIPIPLASYTVPAPPLTPSSPYVPLTPTNLDDQALQANITALRMVFAHLDEPTASLLLRCHGNNLAATILAFKQEEARTSNSVPTTPTPTTPR